MGAYHVDCLSARALCPKVVEEIVEGNVLEEGGFVFKENHPLFVHAGEDKFLPHAIGGSDGCLAIKLA